MTYERDRRPGEAGAGGPAAARPGVPGKHTLTEGLVRRPRVEPSLEKPQIDSIDENRDTLPIPDVLLSPAECARAARRNRRLHAKLGYDPSAFSMYPVDSEAFALDIAMFQRDHGLRVDGICGPRTCEAAGLATGGSIPSSAVAAAGGSELARYPNADFLLPALGGPIGDRTLRPDFDFVGKPPGRNPLVDEIFFDDEEDKAPPEAFVGKPPGPNPAVDALWDGLPEARAAERAKGGGHNR